MAANREQLSEFGPEYLVVFVGYSQDASAAANTIVEVERDIQDALDKFRRVNSNIPFNRVKFWKWNSDAPAAAGGQSANIHPHLKRADIAVFVFNERIGDVAWEELDFSRKRRPTIPVLPMFPSAPPGNERMMQEEVAAGWMELLKRKRSLSAGWTDPDTNALTPLPQYSDLKDLRRIAYERLEAEVIRLTGRFMPVSGAENGESVGANVAVDDSIYIGEGVALKKDENADARIGINDIYGNILSISPKSRGYDKGIFYHTLVKYEGPVLIFDPTGNIYRQTSKIREKFGPVAKLDPQSLITDTRADGLNPADVLDLAGMSDIDSALLLADLLAPHDRYYRRELQVANADPYWPNMQRKLILGLLLMEMGESGSNDGLFSRVRDIICKDDVVYDLAVRLDTKKDMHPVARQEIAAFLQCADNTRSSILSGVSQYFTALSSPVVQRSIDTSTIDIKSWFSGNASSIYIVGPAPGLPSFDVAFHLWLGTIFHVMVRRSIRPATKPLVVVDINEATDTWPGLVSVLTHGGDCLIWLQVPSLDDLSAKFQNTTSAVINNCGLIQAIRPNNFISGRQIADLSGASIEEIMKMQDDDVLVLESGSAEFRTRSR